MLVMNVIVRQKIKINPMQDIKQQEEIKSL